MSAERRANQTTFHQTERGNGFNMIGPVIFFGALSGTLGYLGYPGLCVLTGAISIGFALKGTHSGPQKNIRDKFLK